MDVLEEQPGVGELKTRLRNTWMTGDYGRFCRYMERDAEAFYRRLPIKPGAQLLDVACGAGQLSLIAARAGARVTGCDIAANWLVQARRSAAAEGLTVVFEEGDAEALPYEDA
ncbi:MAG TPA: class I SAM-dependent methyltransferase [Bryobacteraceae bacterium]|nr:class I SAM-dependent methyltransferase [Bryobacteraceae bacterium]